MIRNGTPRIGSELHFDADVRSVVSERGLPFRIEIRLAVQRERAMNAQERDARAAVPPSEWRGVSNLHPRWSLREPTR